MTTLGPGMRVKCIKAGWDKGPGPAVGDICTVLKARIWPEGKPPDWFYLRLAEWTPGRVYLAAHFRPLDQIEAMEDACREQVLDELVAVGEDA